jgi:hypothetical protein
MRPIRSVTNPPRCGRKVLAVLKLVEKSIDFFDKLKRTPLLFSSGVRCASQDTKGLVRGGV